ncbi:hypothetical protein [Shewanella sp. HL-SH2]|uniref:hypothetical protein n=1 Tax=Shewanella sp. HL-SH2 TaxID=3436238 RepID=UPI003EBAB433
MASITQAIEAFIADWQAAQVSSMDVLEQNMAAELQHPYLDKACSDKNGLDKEAQVQLWSIEQWDRVQAKWRDLFTKILS